MKFIEKTEPFGDTFISWQTYKNDGGGLTVKRPPDGEFIVRKDDGEVHGMYEYTDGVIAPSKKLFQRADNGKYTVYFYAKKGVSVKGFCLIEGRDVDYGKVSADFRVPYEVVLKIADGRGKALIENFASARITSPVKCGVLKELFTPYLNAVINGVLGKRLAEETVTNINVKSGEIAEEILQEINKPAGHIYDYGFVAVAVSFSISEEYAHRQEKKRVEHNEYLYKKRGKRG